MIGHISRRNFLLEHVTVVKTEGRIEVTEEEEEDVGSYWMNIRKGEDTENLGRKN